MPAVLLSALPADLPAISAELAVVPVDPGVPIYGPTTMSTITPGGDDVAFVEAEETDVDEYTGEAGGDDPAQVGWDVNTSQIYEPGRDESLYRLQSEVKVTVRRVVNGAYTDEYREITYKPTIQAGFWFPAVTDADYDRIMAAGLTQLGFGANDYNGSGFSLDGSYTSGDWTGYVQDVSVTHYGGWDSLGRPLALAPYKVHTSKD
jgi:hypothetical protein